MEAVQSLSELFPTAPSSARTKNSPDELGQDDFMALMVAQMENQDPTKPMDNFEFLSQIAQFGTVSGIQALQTGLGDLSSALLSSQALQAADLVGREVVTDSNLGTLQAEGELRALGNVLRDQLFYMQRCGIDAFALAEGRDADAALQSLRDFSKVYQDTGDSATPVWRLRGAV